MRQVFKTEALLLNKKSLLEKNILLTFLTKDLGEIKAFAFGVKKITSRRQSFLQTGVPSSNS
jgi:Recombinational DNA repair protein (RecF pathway)